MTTNAGTSTSNQEILKVTGLSASYGEAKVLFDIEVSVKPGQIVACVGRNGADRPVDY
jgi:branched-chain amino acid transport system ATP-binding protein